MEKEEKTLGVLGGMGPKATTDFMEKIMDLTPAERDQDHIRMIVVNDPKVPGRTKAILHGGKSPVPRLKKNARILENSGANFLAIPCNTAHYYYEKIQDAVDIPIINMIAETARVLREKEVEKVGLLSTTATAETGLYHDRMDFTEVITPRNMEKVMRGIKMIKAGEQEPASRELSKIAEKLLEREVEVIIAGCTEIPLVFSKEKFPLVDPVLIMARDVIRRIKGEIPPLPPSFFS